MVARAARWHSRLRATLNRFLRSSPFLGAFALPPEIILIISAYLDSSSVISIALTCRTLYTVCFPQELRLSLKEKEEVLLLLERDTAHLYFCHYCIKLHRWSPRWGKSDVSRYSEVLPCKQQLAKSLFSVPISCYIPYHHARLIMNHHLYGPTHGLPVHRLERKVLRHISLYNVTASETLNLRIVDDRLLVLATTTMDHSGADPRSLRNCVDSVGHSVCKHLTMAKAHPHYAPRQLPELTLGRTTPGYFVPCHTSFRSCSTCLTDYDIEIRPDNERGGLVIQVLAYRQLGDCRSPFDWSWRAMTELRAGGLSRVARSPEYGLGVVRDRWKKADGIDIRSHGAWVEIPTLMPTLD